MVIDLIKSILWYETKGGELLQLHYFIWNTQLYDHHSLPWVAQPLGANPNLNPEENDDAEFVEVLNDVEELFGEPVFFTE